MGRRPKMTLEEKLAIAEHALEEIIRERLHHPHDAPITAEAALKEIRGADDDEAGAYGLRLYHFRGAGRALGSVIVVAAETEQSAMETALGWWETNVASRYPTAWRKVTDAPELTESIPMPEVPAIVYAWDGDY